MTTADDKIAGIPMLAIKIVPSLIAGSYLAAMGICGILRPEQLILAVCFCTSLWIGRQPRRLALALFPLMLFILAYDSMRLYPNYLMNPVDAGPLYFFEKRFFGVPYEGGVLTLCEFCDKHHSLALDLLSGLFYLNWMTVPVMCGVWLFHRDKELFLRYSLAFLVVNLIGFTVYYLHPAAPPWYVARYGFEIRHDIPGSAAGLTRVDTWLGVNLFASIYSRASNVFAPLPSLHCAYPFVVLCYAAIARQRLFTGLAAVFMSGIFFAAVYTGHHYVTDLICGVICAIVGVTIIELARVRILWFRRFLTDWKFAITAQ